MHHPYMKRVKGYEKCNLGRRKLGNEERIPRSSHVFFVYAENKDSNSTNSRKMFFFLDCPLLSTSLKNKGLDCWVLPNIPFRPSSSSILHIVREKRTWKWKKGF